VIRPRLKSKINVIRLGGVVEAHVVHYIGKDTFMWRGTSRGAALKGRGGGLGKCKFADEGLTWTRAVDGPLLDAFVVAVAL